jgi:hypothetical protein
MAHKPIQYSIDACPHDVPWEWPCGFCDDEGIEVPQSVLDAAVERDRKERDQHDEDF